MNELSTCVLGSSSVGNATVIWNSRTAVLVDCGFNPAYMKEGFQDLGLKISDLHGVLITHIHGDHVNESTGRRLIKERIPIYCPSQIAMHLKTRYGTFKQASHEGLLRIIKKSEAELNEFHICSFEVHHDSGGGCFGYSIFSESGGRTRKISVTTDMAYPTKSAIHHMANSDVIVIESNYDEGMLENSSRPAWLKRRIQEEGHLSNDQCADALLQIIDHSHTLPRSLTLAHVSQQCNTNALALGCTREALDKAGIGGVKLFETHPDSPGRTITVDQTSNGSSEDQEIEMTVTFLRSIH
ncbi:MAG: MBL fold metallo-hydrolase [bacterium]